jgi:hypothetical protein
MLEAPIVETQASPFPGVPTESAAFYALEAASVTMQYYRAVLTPGAMLGLAAVMSERLRGLVGWGYYYEEDLARALATEGTAWAERYIQRLDPITVDEEPKTPESTVVPSLGSRLGEKEDDGAAPPELTAALPLALRLQAKRILPRPVWKFLRQSRRAWLSFREPLP